MAVREVPDAWEKANIPPIFTKAGQSDVPCCEGDGANPPGSHFQAPEGQEGDLELPVKTEQGQIVPDQPEYLLR